MPADRELMTQAVSDAEALAPGTSWELQASTRLRNRILLALILVTLPAVFVCSIGSVPTPSAGPQCVFADGTSAPGTCMFVDEFDGSSIDSTKWRVDDNWPGPITGFAPDLDCVRHENVVVSGGSVQLSVTANARASCPQTWDGSGTYYQTNYGAAGSVGHWPTGQATSYDVAVLDQRSFQFTYGHMYLRLKMPAGTGPGVDVSWWGVNCQPGGTMHNYLSDFFAHRNTGPPNGCNFPQSGAQEFDIPNYTWADGDHKQVIFVHLVGNGNGAPFLRKFFGVNYYGDNFAPEAHGDTAYAPYATTWTLEDPSLAYHTYEVDWRPGPGGSNTYSSYYDGRLVNSTSAPWVSTEPKYFMIWALNHLVANPATLPVTAYLDYVRFVCPPGVPCTWSGAGSL